MPNDPLALRPAEVASLDTVPLARGGLVRGWVVLYCFGEGTDILPRHYKTEKQANKFAAEHRWHGKFCQSGHHYEAVVLNVEDIVAWINSGRDELEILFRLPTPLQEEVL